MAVTTPEYSACFHQGNQLSVGLQLADSVFAEDSATVMEVRNGKMRLILCGEGLPSRFTLSSGARAVISRREGRNIFTCGGRIEKTGAGGELALDLDPTVEVNERREYARHDIPLNVEYALPRSQEMQRVLHEWDGLKKCPGDCFKGKRPPCREGCSERDMRSRRTRVNLSGSGLRFKIGDCLYLGTLLHLKVAIPSTGQEFIHAIGSIVRTRELFPLMSKTDYYSTTMAFRFIDSNDRKRLLEYVLAEQHRALL